MRSIAFDSDQGQPICSSYRELTQYFPQPGWVEHDPLEIWELVRATLGEVARQLAAERQSAAAIGITNQRETVVAWNRRTGKPQGPAIVWQDRRTAQYCEQLKTQGHEELVRQTTGLVLDPYFSASKMRWLIRQGGIELGPDLLFGTVDSWVAWNLTGGNRGGAHVTDPSNASRTMLFDIGSRKWSAELADLFEIPLTCLPEVVPSSQRCGLTASAIAGDLPAGIAVSGIAGDQAAALFGQACFEPGNAKCTYGTGSFILMNVGQECPEPVEGVLTSLAWQLGTDAGASNGQIAYALEGAIFSTGSAIQWLRDGLGIIEQAYHVGPLASQVEGSDGAYFVPAFNGLGCPWWDPSARGILTGVTRGIGRTQIARAVVESIAFQVRDAIDLMSGASAGTGTDKTDSVLRCDGGAAAMDLLLQIQADQLQSPVQRASVGETTALGAAWLAGLAEGVWANLDDLSQLWKGGEPFVPSMAPQVADALHQGWLAAVGRSRQWAQETLG